GERQCLGLERDRRPQYLPTHVSAERYRTFTQHGGLEPHGADDEPQYQRRPRRAVARARQALQTAADVRACGCLRRGDPARTVGGSYGYQYVRDPALRDRSRIWADAINGHSGHAEHGPAASARHLDWDHEFF